MKNYEISYVHKKCGMRHVILTEGRFSNPFQALSWLFANWNSKAPACSFRVRRVQ